MIATVHDLPCSADRSMRRPLTRLTESNASPPTARSGKLIPYVTAAAGSAGLATLVLQLWKADLSIPFVRRLTGDVLFYEMLIKGMVDNRGYLHNRFLGMPWGQDLYDYPIADQLHLLLLKVISVFLGDAGATLNVFYLATFPLVAVCALAALREFGVSDGPALVASVLFSLLPFHFLRGEAHLFLAVYYLVPLVLMVVLWLSLDRPLVAQKGERRGLHRLLPRAYVALLVVALSGVAGIYHAFFSGFFLAVGGILGAASRRSRRPLLGSVVLIAVLLIIVVTALSPSILYIAREGRNPFAAKREQYEAELLGLKLVHLVLPIREHRFPPLATLRYRYDRAHQWPLENENTTSALGLVGSFGLLCLLARIVFGWPRLRDDELVSHLARLAVAAVLLATAGGLSSLVALLVSPEIRGYNRVSVFIAFLSLFATAIALDRLGKSWKGSPLLFRCLLGLILALGVLDQTSPSFVPLYDALAKAFHGDREFVQRVEALLPPGAMIFELPHVSFFEGPPVNRTYDYEPVSLYLQSRQLRWSYGAMKGRDADDWQLDLLDRPLEEVVERLALVGFAGITVDRNGYPDGGSDIERRLAGLLQASAVQSADARYVFFDLSRFAAALRASIDGESWANRRESALYPTLVSWRGCRGEPEPDSGVRRCAPEAEVTLRNTANAPQHVTVEAELAAVDDEPLELSLASTVLSADLRLASKPLRFTRTILLPPGRHVLRFMVTGRATDASTRAALLDFRVLTFRVRNLLYTAVSGATVSSTPRDPALEP
jgi:hypothetical protein